MWIVESSEHKNDSLIISNKTFDFSRTTIKELMQDEYRETKEQMREILSRPT
jgi:NTE family protein